MLTFDAEKRKEFVSALKTRNEVLREQMFGANGIKSMDKAPKQGTQDASALAEFTQRMVEYIDNTLEATEYPDTTYRQVFTLKTDIDPGADVYVKYETDANGEAELINEEGTDVPMLELGAVPNTRPIKPYGLGYRITQQEILRATMARRPISMEKPQECRRMVEEKLDRIYWLGDAKVGIYGLLNHPNIPLNASASATPWASATATQIETDILTVINRRMNATGFSNMQFDLGLPLSSYQAVTQKRLGTSQELAMTVAQWLIQQIPQLRGFFATNRLKEASPTDTDNLGAFIPVGSQWGYGIHPMDVRSVGPHPSSILGEDYLLQARTGGFFTLKPLRFELIEGI